MTATRFMALAAPLCLCCAACDDTAQLDIMDDVDLEERYLSAIDDAISADAEELASDLISLTTDDARVTWQGDGEEARVLVVTWTSYPDSYAPGETVTAEWGDLWVTVSPELKDRLADAGDTTSLRIAQLLGLPPDSAHTHFAQLWVSPTDMFRPCPDNEIDDNACDLALPQDAEDWYVAWYEHNVFTSYFPPAYPWTRLGYTYDWAKGADERGLSEFVVKQGATFVVESLESTEEYLGLP